MKVIESRTNTVETLELDGLEIREAVSDYLVKKGYKAIDNTTCDSDILTRAGELVLVLRGAEKETDCRVLHEVSGESVVMVPKEEEKIRKIIVYLTKRGTNECVSLLYSLGKELNSVRPTLKEVQKMFPGYSITWDNYCEGSEEDYINVACTSFTDNEEKETESKDEDLVQIYLNKSENGKPVRKFTMLFNTDAGYGVNSLVKYMESKFPDYKITWNQFLGHEDDHINVFRKKEV